MARPAWLGVAIVAGLALGALALTGWALEGRDVAVLLTRAPFDGWRRTRVWVVEADGALWVEAATPERTWYLDVLRDPRVVLEHDGRRRAMRAQPRPGAAGHQHIRAWLRAKYGWADAWVGLLQDTSRSIAVRLVPERALGTAAAPGSPTPGSARR